MNLRQLCFKCACLLALMASVTSCDKKASTTPTDGSMNIYCDNSFENILEELISVYEYRYPNTHILPRYTTQIEAVDSLMEGNTKTIIIGRDLTANEKAILKNRGLNPRSKMLAVDAVALIVNNDNPVDVLSYNEIGQILTGGITRWSQIQPDAPDLPINVFFDSPGSSLAIYMSDSLANKQAFGSNVYNAGSVQKVFDEVKSRRGAIGVVGVSCLTRDLQADESSVEDRVKALTNDSTPVDGQAINDRMDNAGVKTIAVMKDQAVPRRPYQQYIYDGLYPLTRQIYMISTSYPGGLPGAFYTYCLGVDGQRVIMHTGVMPARVNRNIVELVE